MTPVPARQLANYLQCLYEAAGMTRVGARVMADAQVEADLRGIFGHGSRLAPTYLDKLRTGRLNPRPLIRAVRDEDAIRVVDADLAPGPLAAQMAAASAMLRARRWGIAAVTVRRAGHVGALGIPAAKVARRGLVGVVAAQASARSVALHGGTSTPVLGSSALAVAVPGPDRQRPVLVDLAAAAMSWGRLHQLARTGQALPDGTALDANGRATHDPTHATVLLPAGERGQALAIVLELLVGVLTGSPPAPTGDDGRGLLVMAIDPRRLGTADLLPTGIAALADAVRQQGARMPGDRAWSHRDRALHDGVRLNASDLAALLDAGRRLNIPAPHGWARPAPSRLRPPKEKM
ncbi:MULTISPECIES: Ldh family oxidoreductase [Micromonospora]|uniref:Ldh family oxidoreductase n=1 Tax=Micromonospora TaxID=1873 RepID=UPI00130DCC15|nr:Ldh family oxidoreductase [Micromonospora haikouensis]